MQRSILPGMALLALATAAACRDPGQLDSRENAYQRVLRTRTLRTAYISYPPSFIKDPNSGAYSGIFHEVLQKMGESMGIRIVYTEEVAWGTMIEAIESQRVDLVCTGIWPTAARGLRADFTDAIYYSTVRAYRRSADTRFDGKLHAANSPSTSISAIDGEMSSIIARSDYPNSRLVSLPQTSDVSQLLLEVSTKKADLTFVEPAVGEAFRLKNPRTVDPVANVPPVRIFPNVMMVGKGEVELLSTLNTAIEELVNTGFVGTIVDKYEVHTGSFIRRRPPTQ